MPHDLAGQAAAESPLSQRLQQARMGCQTALEELLKLRHPHLLQVANLAVQQAGGPVLSADELVQQTFFQARQTFDRFEGHSTDELQRWLLEILECCIGRSQTNGAGGGPIGDLPYGFSDGHPDSAVSTRIDQAPAATPCRSDALDLRLNWRAFLGLQGGQFGRFDVIRLLSFGGHGVVFLARDPLLSRLVALKMLRPEFSIDPSMQKRFQAEGRAAASLTHPNVVTVFESGEVGAVNYLAQDYIPGPSLAQWMRKHPAPVSPRLVATIVLQLAEGVAHAHSRHILHRDIKPGNVLLAPKLDAADLDSLDRFVPKLADFGLAKLLTELDQTRTVGAMGTPRYMSPEQAAGRQDLIGGASDVYSLGVILFELLTNQPPFQGTNDLDTLQQVLHGELPRPRTVVSDIPGDLEAICLKCLARECRDRYPSAEALSRDLRCYLEDRPVSARPASVIATAWKWCRRNPVVAGLASAVILAVLTLLGVSLRYNARLNESLQVARQLVQEKSALATSEQQLRIESNRQLAYSLFEQSHSKCVPDDAATGLLWLTRSLQRADELDVDDLAQALRRQIAGWSQHVFPVRNVWALDQPVTWVAFTPDGKSALSVCADDCIRVWNIETGALRYSPIQHSAEIKTAAMSPDGKSVAAACTDGVVRFWETETGRRIDRDLSHDAVVLALAYRPDGRQLITGSEDRTARLWTLDGEPSAGLSLPHDGAVTCVAFSPDGSQVLTGSSEGTARIWNSATGKAVGAKIQHSSIISVAAFSPDGTTVLTADRNGQATISNADTGELIGVPMTGQSGVHVAAFSPSGKTVATGGADQTVRLWDAATGKPVGKPLPHRALVTSVSISAEGNVLLTSNLDWKARLWDVATSQQIGSAMNCQVGVRRAVFSPDGRTVLSGDDGGFVRLWDVSATTPQRSPRLTETAVEILAVHPRQDVILTAGFQVAQLWDLPAWTPRGRPMTYGGTIQKAKFSPDGKTILLCTGYGAHTAQVWDAETQEPLGPPIPHPHVVRDGAFAPDGKTFVTASFDNCARVWDVQSQRSIGEPIRHPGGVYALAISPDGRTLLTGCTDHYARRWNLESRTLVEPALRHNEQVCAVAYSADGKTIVTGSFDHTARQWDAETGLEQGAPFDHGEIAVQFVALTPDGETLMTGMGSNQVRFWNVRLRKPFGPPTPSIGDLRGLCLSPDGWRLWASNQENTVCSWDLPHPVQGPTDRIARWATAITGMELTGTDAVRPLDGPTWAEQVRRLAESGDVP